MTRRPRISPRWLLLCALVALGACKSTTDPGLDGGVDGGPPPDVCNSKEEALTADCQLTPDAGRLDYLSVANDQDWFSFQLPATADARTLVHVVAGYSAPATPVNLTVNLLRDDGTTSLVRKSDEHGQGAPRPVELIERFGEPSATLLLKVSDEGLTPSQPAFDVKNPYSVLVQIGQDPDVNEPNDTTATAIPLTGSPMLQGSQTGYLSTADDVDTFQFDVPAGRKVAYVHLTAPVLTPPPAYRLAYTLLDPSGTPISEGNVANAFLPVDLATARLSQASGTYTLVLQGYKPNGETAPVPGDLRLEYTIDVSVMDDVDGNEPNDTQADATVFALASGASKTVTGRIGYVPDPDWYAFDLPANASPSLLHYTVKPTGAGGRFPPLAGVVDREVRVFTDAPDANACKLEDTVCPKGYEGDNSLVPFVEGFCEQNLCLHSYRLEVPHFDGLRNFEGMIPVPAHASTVRYYVVVEDQGTNWADDKDYTLTVESLADADEAARSSGGVEQTPVAALADDTAGGTFPVPATATVLQGTLNAGYGRILAHEFNLGEGVRGPQDYDGVPTDQDRYELDLPALTDPQDRTWELQWSIENLPDGGRPYDLALGVEFCDGDAMDGGVCTPVSTTSGGGALVLAYHEDPFSSWYNVDTSQSLRQPLYDLDAGGAATTITARAYGCYCFEPRFVKGGKFFLTVGALDRNSYETAQYTVRTAFTSYPKSFAVDGGTQSCPAPVQDADSGVWAPGCAFTQ